MKEQIIKIIESKAQGKYHLEIDKSDLEVIANEILNLFIVSQQRELLQCFCKLTNITHDTVNKDIEDVIHSFNAL